jgi:hypothetical protein
MLLLVENAANAGVTRANVAVRLKAAVAILSPRTKTSSS